MVLESYQPVVRCDGSRHDCYGTLVVSSLPKDISRNGMKDHGICTVAVQLPSKIETYVSVGYLKRNPEISTEGREELVIGLKFASTLGLEDGDVVNVSQVDDGEIPVSLEVYAEVSEDDWPIVEKNKNELQDCLMNQIRIVKSEMVVPVWLHGNLIEIIIVRTVPSEGYVQFKVDKDFRKSRTSLIIGVKGGKKKSSGSSKGDSSLLFPSKMRRSSSLHSKHPMPNRQVGAGPSATIRRSVPNAPPDTEEDSVHRMQSWVSRAASDTKSRKSPSSRQADGPTPITTTFPFPGTQRQDSGSGGVLDVVRGMVNNVGRYLQLVQPPVSTAPTDSSVDGVASVWVKQKVSQPSSAVSKKVNGIKDHEAMLIDIPEEGYLLRVQRTPDDFFQTLLKTDDLENDHLKALVKQPTTLFVSEESFPSLKGKRNGLHRSYGSYVTIQVAKRTELVMSDNAALVRSGRASANGSKTNGSMPPTPSVRSSTENPFLSGTATNMSDVKKEALSDDKEQDAEDKKIIAVGRLFVCNGSIATHVARDHVVMHDTMRRFLGAAATVCVQIKTVSHKNSKVQGLSLHPLFDNVGGVYEQDKVKSFFSWVQSITTDRCPLPIVNNQLLAFKIRFQPTVGQKDFVVNVVTPQPALGSSQQLPEPLYFLLSHSRIRPVRITATGEPLSPSDASLEYKRSSNLPPASVELLDPKLPSVTLSHLGGVKELIEKGLEHLRTCLTRRLVQSLGGCCSGLAGGGLLICGTSRHSGNSVGCGKSSLALALCHQMAQFPVLAHIIINECTALRGRRVDVVKSRLEEVFDEAACHQPSIVLLENLDNLVSAPAAGAVEGGSDVLHTTKLAEMICDLVNRELNRNTSLALIATVRSTDALHSRLLPGRGKHYFQNILELKIPSEEQRKEILEAIIKTREQKIDQQCDLSAIAHQTIGFCPRDLDKLVEQAAHLESSEKVKDRSKHKMPRGGLYEPVGPGVTMPKWKDDDILTQGAFNKVLKSLKPISLRTISLHSPGELTWNDVGGLKNVKKTLRETLEWPSKYPKLFAKCPLRLQSGLLLYGAPGTGKTLLAGVVSKECGLNFISIKGPELLNKYIGASEQAVRQIFERAQSAKPCVLFFDEFDSIVPKRGHDSTGVTDRVVNMFLTQLDGVESLDGVYVLAATSRPDLIDPALLRPGRLDKSLFCPLPDKFERKEILLALSHNVRVDDVCFDKLAEQTEHFSGADLKALLFNAQLEAIQATDVYSRDVASTPQEVDVEIEKLSKSFLHLGTSTLPEIMEDNDNAFEFDKLSIVSNPENSDWRSEFGSRLTDLKTKSDFDDNSFGWSPAKMRNSTPSKLDLTPHVSTASWSTSSGGGDNSNEFSYMPSIADGVRKIPAEICREMKRKYNEAYYSRTGLLSDRRTSLVSQKWKMLQSNQMQVTVTQVHLSTALLNMGPSLSEKEQLKYEEIYQRFAKMRSSEEISLEHFKQKATLA